ncbi:patatin-like phospholipase family protein [Bdellovibrio sp. SKB1291214]|uniref:patatin-like phospholipase family protein n=1 Tax=Bdellovibrio sp. SKB1291214 TaxID=1732569 RepID=UPI000B51C0AA|nr:patatin-like phospholipase family protein [Bdellovibrio sp. SKB1291214]UYL10392.1 patatin-like phospholipase family protein [Bdellovibrio sp. SKB1291214]
MSLIFLAGCQSLKTREDIRTGTKPSTPSKTATTYPSSPRQAEEPSTPYQPDMQVEEPPPAPLPTPVIPAMPKIAFILGGGGAKTYAHIGFLHEITRAKVPVYAIGGVEFASPMAALYANREQANDVEWQMFKLKDEEIIKKSLLGNVNKNGDISVMKDFYNTAFKNQKADDFRIPFACPSYNLKKNQTLMMNRGGMEQLLSMCMAYPPFFKPFQGNVAGIREISGLARYLRQKGANFVVLVNVLQAPGGNKPFTLDSAATDNVLWSEIAGLYNKPFAGVDTVITLDTGDYGIMDFDKRREIMNKGADSANRQLKTLTRKWGL